MIQKVIERNFRVAERTTQGEAVNLVMEREDNHSAVRMCHFHMASAPMNLDEAKPLQCGEDFPARKEREFHSEISTTSSAADGTTSLEGGSK